MLTARQLYFPLVPFQFFTKIGLLPLLIDAKTGRIRRQHSQKLKLWWHFLLILGAVLHGFFAAFQLISFFTSPGDKQIEDLPFVINLFVYPAGLYLFLSTFVWNRNVTIMTFNFLFEGSSN